MKRQTNRLILVKKKRMPIKIAKNPDKINKKIDFFVNLTIMALLYNLQKK